jgi:Raf kinase inhibitor-like YbhB/YbcL family protein
MPSAGDAVHCVEPVRIKGESSMSAKRLGFVAGSLLLGFSLGGTMAEAAEVFTLSSTTFQDGKLMPKKVANNAANSHNNPNCVGDNVSPQFSWSNVPEGAKSFVFFMTDPEGRAGAGVFHWVAYGIPTSVSGFAEGEVSKPSDKYVGGKSTQGVGFYSGPCTPPNTMPHHYTFVLVATDFDPKELQPGLTHDEVVQQLAPNGGPPVHAKGFAAGLVGLFVNPWKD